MATVTTTSPFASVKMVMVPSFVPGLSKEPVRGARSYVTRLPSHTLACVQVEPGRRHTWGLPVSDRSLR
jgi:hypothetical protein